MARTINRIELLGRVGTEPEMRYAPTGTAVTTFRVATDRRRQSGETETDWHNVVCFAKQAEAVNTYVGKGDRIYLCGSLAHSSYETEDGQPAVPHRGARLGGRLPRLPQRRAQRGRERPRRD